MSSIEFTLHRCGLSFRRLLVDCSSFLNRGRAASSRLDRQAGRAACKPSLRALRHPERRVAKALSRGLALAFVAAGMLFDVGPALAAYDYDTYGPFRASPLGEPVLHLSSASVAINKVAGVVVVSWVGYDPLLPPDGLAVWVRRYDINGTPLGAPTRANAPGQGVDEASSPSVSVNKAGHFVVAWTSNFPDRVFIFSHRYDPAGNPVDEALTLPEFFPTSGTRPSVAMSSDGSYVVSWYSNGAIYFVKNPLVPLPTQASTLPVGPDSNPSVAMNSETGTFVVVWKGGPGIVARRFDSLGNTDPSVPEVVISSATLAPGSSPSAAMGSNGNFVVAWNDGLATFFGVYGQPGYPLSQSMRASGPVEEVAVDDSSSPSVAIDDAGMLAVGWNQLGGPAGIFVRHYDIAGLPGTPPIPLSDPMKASGEHWILPSTSPSVGTWDNRSFVVGWNGEIVAVPSDGPASFFSRFELKGTETATVATPTGSPVQVGATVTLPNSTAAVSVTLEFTNVTAEGQTTVKSSNSGPTPPQGFKVGDPPVFYDIATTATISGGVKICFSWESGQFDDDALVRMFHYEQVDTSVEPWVNVTTDLFSANERKVCGFVASLSPFMLAEVIPYPFTGFFQPVDNPPTLNSVKAGQAVPVKFSLGGDRGLDIFAAGYPTSQRVSCTDSAGESAIEETVRAGGSSLEYDSTTARYTYVWKTSSTWANSCRVLILRFKDGSEHAATFRFK